MTAIAAALRAGRLPAPLSELALGPYLGQMAGSVAPMLIKLTTEGLSAEHLAFFLDLLADALELPRTIDGAIELVATGPEVAGLPARDTRIVVRELFRRADQSVLVAGYAVYQGRDVFSALAERMEAIPHLAVRMFLDVQRPRGDTSRPSEILRRFADRFKSHEWPGSRLPEVYYDPRALQTDTSTRTSLHAKCVVIDERTAFVSSANFTEAAQIRNIEVGALIRVEAFAQQLARHFLGLAEQHLLERLPGF
jgi:phosphatidylserine/phosphatidylglycerophosphate/cardiolipin synthase-like enzyme